MNQSRDPDDWPQPLVTSNDGVGPVVRKVIRRLEAGRDDEASAFARTQAALLRRRTTRRFVVFSAAAAAATAAAAVAALWLTVSDPFGRGSRPALGPTIVATKTTPAPAAPPAPLIPQPQPPPPEPPRARVIRPGARPVALFSGRTELQNEATVIIRDVARATARADRRGSTIVLDDGRIDLQVRPRPPERAFAVQAGPFRFVVVGTAFTVSRHLGSVALEVTEGRVAVVRGNRTLAAVTAGGWWTGESKDASTSAASSPSAAAAVPAACVDLISGKRWREAIQCLEQRAGEGQGPSSDVAAYEAARLWKDAVGDLSRAATAFAAYRARFPHGSLRVEASLSLLEILPRLGRYQEALAEADRVLAEPAAQPRRTEVHLLRGNILRAGLGDRSRALADYRAAGEGTGRAADEGAFLNAICLEELGRRQEAREAFDLYLARPAPGHAQEATRRRKALDQ